MVVANFIVPIQNNSPVWPAQRAESGVFVFSGVSTIGPGPIVATWLTQIISDSDADMAWLKAQPNWQFIEDVVLPETP